MRLGNAKDHMAGKFYGHLQMHYAATKKMVNSAWILCRDIETKSTKYIQANKRTIYFSSSNSSSSD